MIMNEWRKDLKKKKLTQTNIQLIYSQDKKKKKREREKEKPDMKFINISPIFDYR